MRSDLPSGTVTFLFTDVEGSTKLLHELGAEGYAQALAEHRRVLRDAFTRHGGVEVDTQGDAFFVAFPSAEGALAAAGEARERLAAGPIRVRKGIHSGTPHVTEEGYVGVDVHRAARIGATGHGGQIVISAATAALVGRDGLVELGEHRLKDFDAPVPLYQLGEEAFPPLKTLSNTNLPRPASSFVGREREVDEVVSLLRDRARLVTLTGPGGSGKTRLALEAAATLVPEFKAGVFWVGLAALRDPGLVTETIAQTLGAKDGLAEHIAERELLLLIDNLEQVVEAAPELASLVETCPSLHLLVTSRELLRVRGEREYPVLPLAEREAVELFCERARVEPDESVHALCRALDQLPLALELAAARASVLSPAQILERLSQRLDVLKGGRDADPRQQTLRATIEWSYDLLSEDEQQLFAHLAVFRGGCSLDAAEAVVDADLDVLQSLVDKSLVRRTGERFWMLETIREYAAERLEESGEAEEVRRRHAMHFVALAETAGPNVEKSPQTYLDRLDAENDNLRAALDWLEGSSEIEQALHCAGQLAPFWETRDLREGRARLERLLPRDDRPTPPRAKALVGAALLARQSGDAVAARKHSEEALALYRHLGDVHGAADASLHRAVAVADEGDFARARDLFNESAELFHDAGDEDNAVFARRMLGWMLEELGELDRAREVHEDNLRRARELSNRQMEGQTLSALAGLAIEDGRTDAAVSLLKDVLCIDRERGDALQAALDLIRFARALASPGLRAADAARLLASAEAFRNETAGGSPPYVVRNHEQALALIRNELDEAELAGALAEGKRLSIDEAVELALDVPQSA